MRALKQIIKAIVRPVFGMSGGPPHIPGLSADTPCHIVDCQFEPIVRIEGSVTLIGCRIGRNTYVMPGVQAWNTQVGRFCSIATDAILGLGEHPSCDFVSTHPIFYSYRPNAGMDLVQEDVHNDSPPTIIGHDVWIGARAMVRAGLRVGNGAIIGAGAIVTHDVPDYAIVVGVPARVLRSRFDGEHIRFLNELQWWDRTDDWLRSHAVSFRDVRLLKDAVQRCEVGVGSCGSTNS